MKMLKNISDAPFDYFNDENATKNLKGKAIRSGSISVITRGLNTIILVGGVLVLARLLSPADYGLVAMSTVFTNFFLNFAELGLTDATIQATRISHEQVSTLFWIIVSVGIAITIVIIGLSPAIAAFYKRPQLKLILLVSSLGFAFSGFRPQHIALLKRHFLFGKIMAIELIANIISTIAAVIVVIAGGGYWGLVSRPLISTFTSMILTWSFCRWRPGPPRRNSGVRPLLKIGAHSIGFYLVDYLTKNLDKSLIGKKYGAESLGYYSRANYLATTPAGQFAQSLFHVAVSTLSKLRENPEEYRRYYLKSLSVISFLGMPMSIFMVVMSPEMIYLLLGPKWNQAAGLFSILGLSGGMLIISWTQGWLHVSLGRTDRWLRWGILRTIIMVAGFFLGLSYGSRGVAIAYSAVIIITTFPGLSYAGRPIDLRVREILSVVWRIIGASTLAGLLVYAIKRSGLVGAPVILRLISFLFVYSLAYLTLVTILSWSIKPIIEMTSFLRDIIKRTSLKSKAGNENGVGTGQTPGNVI